jgi:hypothetical protein
MEAAERICPITAGNGTPTVVPDELSTDICLPEIGCPRASEICPTTSPHGAEAAAAVINAVAIDKTAINFFIASSPVQMTLLVERAAHPTQTIEPETLPTSPTRAVRSLVDAKTESARRSTWRRTNAVGIE